MALAASRANRLVFTSSWNNCKVVFSDRSMHRLGGADLCKLASQLSFSVTTNILGIFPCPEDTIASGAEHEEAQQRREEERKKQFERMQVEYEAEQTRREESRKSREATFERIIANAPAVFMPAHLRVLLRAIVNLGLYTFADDLAGDLAGEKKNEQRTAEEVLLSTIDTLTDDKLTSFAIRLVLAGHRGIPREGEFDFVVEAEKVFTPLPPAK